MSPKSLIILYGNQRTFSTPPQSPIFGRDENGDSGGVEKARFFLAVVTFYAA
jgi:hypothetical protein